jgi:CheY-like chemotaxis protein/HPt (histidine-containing phosphotransfer) domain-containing protein
MLDFNMPHMDGVALARKVRAEPWGADIRLVMLISSGNERVAARDAGVDTYLTKPVRHDRLARALTRRARARAQGARAGRAAGGDVTLGGDERILVVEDNQVNQLVARAMLERMGHRVDVACDGLEAVAMWGARDYAAIFMDCQMPKLDGYAASKRIRALEAGASRVPIIAITANVMTGDRERCTASGMDDYLPKPIKLEALRAALARWTGQGRARKALAAEAPDGPTVPIRLFDPLTAARLREDFAPEVLGRLVNLFVEHTPPELDALAAAAEAGDSEALWRVAHRLDGSCRAVGAAAMELICAEHEALGRSGETGGGAALVEELRAAFQPTVDVVGPSSQRPPPLRSEAPGRRCQTVRHGLDPPDSPRPPDRRARLPAARRRALRRGDPDPRQRARVRARAADPERAGVVRAGAAATRAGRPARSARRARDAPRGLRLRRRERDRVRHRLPRARGRGLGPALVRLRAGIARDVRDLALRL